MLQSSETSNGTCSDCDCHDRKLTAEERERKLQEMMDNAKWREEQRSRNVEQYKQEDDKESSRLSTYQGDASFLR